MSKYWYFRMRLVMSGRFPPDSGRRIDAFGPAECRGRQDRYFYFRPFSNVFFI